MGEALKTDFPEVLKSCLLGYQRSGVLQQGTITVESSAITMADPGFLKMFDFPLVMGNPDKVFTEPNQVVITDRMAANLFGRDWISRKMYFCYPQFRPASELGLDQQQNKILN